MYVKEGVVIYLTLFCLKTTAKDFTTGHFSLNMNENETSAAIKCILKIVKKQMISSDSAVSIVYSNADVNYFIEEVNSLESYGVVVRTFDSKNWLVDADAFIMLTGNVEELATGLAQITLETFWEPKSNIIVHVFNLTTNRINEVFNIFLKYRVYNVIIVSNVENDNNDADIYNYYPFENGYCGKRFGDAKLTKCEHSESIKDFFPKAQGNLFKNCSAKVLVSEDIPNVIVSAKEDDRVWGLEHFLLETIAEVEGVHLEFKISNIGFGIVLRNHTSTGLLASLQNNEADIAASGFVLIKNRADIFDYVYGFNFATLDVYTPALNNPIWGKVYKEFDTDTWILLFVYFVLIVIICTALLKLAPKLYDKHSGLLLKLWGFFYIGNSSASLLKVKRLRAILTCWIWFTFLISNFYTTALYSLVTGQVKQSQELLTPENLQSLKPLRPCISDSIRTYFLYAFRYEFPENAPLPECHGVESSLDAVANRKDLYAIEMTYSYELREDRYIDRDGNRKLDSWRFSADNTFTLYLSRGFPLTKNFQKHSQRMFESGLLQRYKNFIVYKTRPAFVIVPKTFKNVTLSDITNHFFVLIIGFIASLICLILEIHVNKMKHVNNRIAM